MTVLEILSRSFQSVALPTKANSKGYYWLCNNREECHQDPGWLDKLVPFSRERAA